MASRSDRKQGFHLDVPIDATPVGEIAAEHAQDLRVVVKAASGQTLSKVVSLARDRRGSVGFDFEESPGSVSVHVGPATATDDELLQSQTLKVDVAGRLWSRPDLTIAPISIAPFWWYRWLRWCREYVVRGRVLCPDGDPVPGALVTASDVDWWFLWSGMQEVGQATTDINGAFEIKFRWCCGWAPWWWWTRRTWQLDEILQQRIGAVLATRPELQLDKIDHQPGLAPFAPLLKSESLRLGGPMTAADVEKLDDLRLQVLERLPASEELTRLRVWPWWPWWPWWDCAPDLIFKVTQACQSDQRTTIVEETVWDTRWNVSSPLDVTLVANNEACCLPTRDPSDCFLIDTVCGIPVVSIGGNAGAAASPAGFAYPGALPAGSVGSNADRPFGGNVTITKNPGDLIGVDYMELERFDPASGTWTSLPLGAELDFSRGYFELPIPPSTTPTYGFPGFPVLNLSGRRVWKTRERYEADSGAAWYPAAGWTRAWLSSNFSLLASLDSTKFVDGETEFRAVGWQDDGAGGLTGRQVMPICGSDTENRLVLAFDNRTETPIGHPASHNCGSVHICTLEPDTQISAVRINGALVNACDTARAVGPLEIDFEVTDPDGHLGAYSLIATWGLNQSHDLLGLGAVVALSAATQVGPTYGQALGQPGGVVPIWSGGRYRLTIADAASAFPDPCCYQLELRAAKRTIVDCYGGFAHDNLTEYSLGVGIC